MDVDSRWRIAALSRCGKNLAADNSRQRDSFSRRNRLWLGYLGRWRGRRALPLRRCRFALGAGYALFQRSGLERRHHRARIPRSPTWDDFNLDWNLGNSRCRAELAEAVTSNRCANFQTTKKHRFSNRFALQKL